MSHLHNFIRMQYYVTYNFELTFYRLDGRPVSIIGYIIVVAKFFLHFTYFLVSYEENFCQNFSDEMAVKSVM